jgi:hypothetical protein
MTARASREGRVLEAAKHRLTTGKTGHRAAVPSNRRAACGQVRESVAYLLENDCVGPQETNHV